MPADDLAVLSDALRAHARVDANGEVSWPLRDARAALSQLAGAGRVVLGVDIRDYNDDATFIEIPWSVYEGSDPIEALNAALQALSCGELPGDWALITWRA